MSTYDLEKNALSSAPPQVTAPAEKATPYVDQICEPIAPCCQELMRPSRHELIFHHGSSALNMLIMFATWYFINYKYAGHWGICPPTKERCCYYVLGQVVGWASAECLYWSILRPRWRLRTIVKECRLAHCARLEDGDMKECVEKSLLD